MIKGPFGRQITVGSPGRSIFGPTTPIGATLKRIFRAHLPTKRKNEIIPGYIAVKFPSRVAATITADPIARKRFTPAALSQATFRNRVHRSGWTVWQIGKGEDPYAVVSRLKGTPGVVTAQPLNKIYPLLDPPDDGDFSYIETSETMVPLGEGASFRRLWYLDETSAEDAWNDWPNFWFTSANKPRNVPLIAVIDTGVEQQHPDFINAGGSTSHAAQGGQLELDLDAQFQFGEVLETGTSEDAMGHGTHVSGLALASGNNGSWNGKGIIGLGYPSKGMHLRVFDNTGSGSDADAAGAIWYAVESGADIINLSLGTENVSQIFQDAVTYAWQRGVLVVCASNEDGAGGGDLGPIYPAASSGALAVTANGMFYTHASDYYAGTGSYIDIAAPGGNLILDYSDIENPLAMLTYIYSTTMTTDNPIMGAMGGSAPPGYELGYGYLIGTSMASPIVAGTASLYYGKHNLRASEGWNNLRVYRALQRSAWGVYGAPNGSWETHQGYGSLDAFMFLQDADTRTSTAGAIEGIIYYEGTATGNARIRARKDGGNVTYETTSSPDGRYRFDQLPVGNYTVTGIAFGQSRVTRAVVVPGSDCPGVNFWCGTYTGDDTPPTIASFRFLGWQGTPGANGYTSSKFRLWAYDTETGIEEFAIKLGSSAGGSDLLAKTVLTMNGPEAVITHPEIPPSGKIFATLEVRNGNLTVTTQTIQLGVGSDWDAELVGHTIPTSVAAGSTFQVTFTMRNVGKSAWSSSDQIKFALVAQPGTLGPSRMSFPPGLSVPKGGTVTFRATLTAPSSPGVYWLGRQLKRGATNVGPATPNIMLVVE